MAIYIGIKSMYSNITKAMTLVLLPRDTWNTVKCVCSIYEPCYLGSEFDILKQMFVCKEYKLNWNHVCYFVFSCWITTTHSSAHCVICRSKAQYTQNMGNSIIIWHTTLTLSMRCDLNALNIVDNCENWIW